MVPHAGTDPAGTKRRTASEGFGIERDFFRFLEEASLVSPVCPERTTTTASSLKF